MSDKPSYQPQPGGLAARVCGWFAKNREEELNSRDIGQKFDVPSSSVAAQLANCITHGYIATSNDGGGRVYTAGPNLSTFEAIVPTGGALGKALGEGRRRIGSAPPLDVSSIEIEVDVPKPATRNPVTATYKEVLDRMKVGNSVMLSRDQAKKLYNLALSENKAAGGTQAWSLRVVNDAQARVWRDA